MSSNKIKVDKNRTNKLSIDLGFDITGDTITSEIRAEQDPESLLLGTWTVAVIDAATGQLELTMDNTVTADIAVDSGWMDIKRLSGGEPLSVFDRPLEVAFQGTVTA